MVRFAALIAIVLLLAPSLAVAQATEPVGTVSDDETSVSRGFDSDQVGQDTIFGIFAIGSVGESDAEATGMMTTLPAVIASGIAGSVEESGATTGPPETVTAAPIGDQSTAIRMSYTLYGAVDGEVVVLAVRQSSWVQMLVGMGIGTADVQAQLETLARQLAPRWPSTDAITVRADGLRVGGIWAMMPLPEDLPGGYTVDPEVEEGPGPGAAQPGGPALPATTPVPGAPTPTPSLTLPDETPTAPETPAATPAPNPRLALPFDVTVEVFLPLDLATIDEEDGTCSGAGLLGGLNGDAQMTLREDRAAGAEAAAPMTGPGQIGLDRETGEEVCYFRATLTDVPARAEYTLAAGDTVLGHYTYDELAETGAILVVVGGE